MLRQTINLNNISGSSFSISDTINQEPGARRMNFKKQNCQKKMGTSNFRLNNNDVIRWKPKCFKIRRNVVREEGQYLVLYYAKWGALGRKTQRELCTDNDFRLFAIVVIIVYLNSYNASMSTLKLLAFLSHVTKLNLFVGTLKGKLQCFILKFGRSNFDNVPKSNTEKNLRML